MIVKTFQNLKNRMEKMQEGINTINTITNNIDEIRNKQSEVNNTIAEIKNTLEGPNSRLTEAEEWISELEDRMVEVIAEEQNKGKIMKRIEDSLGDPWNTNKNTSIQVIGVPEEEEKRKAVRTIFKRLQLKVSPA